MKRFPLRTVARNMMRGTLWVGLCHGRSTTASPVFTRSSLWSQAKRGECCVPECQWNSKAVEVTGSQTILIHDPLKHKYFFRGPLLYPSHIVEYNSLHT